MDTKAHAEDLARRRARARGMGGDEAVARPTLIRALEMARTKRVDLPWRKHGVLPV